MVSDWRDSHRKSQSQHIAQFGALERTCHRGSSPYCSRKRLWNLRQLQHRPQQHKLHGSVRRRQGRLYWPYLSAAKMIGSASGDFFVQIWAPEKKPVLKSCCPYPLPGARPPKPGVGDLRQWGLVQSVPVSSKENDREWTDGGGGGGVS